MKLMERETPEQKEAAQLAKERADLEARHGTVWNGAEVVRDYRVLEFAAAHVVVVRRSDNVKGSLRFQGAPRFYFSFVAA